MAAASADSQDDMAFTGDNATTLSTVEEGSEESQAFTQNLSIECEDSSGARNNEQALGAGRFSDTAYDDDDYADDDNDAREVQDGGDVETVEQANADKCDASSSRYEMHGDDATAEQHDSHDHAQHGASYVGRCYVRLERLRKRKRHQEERVEELVEAAFVQIDALVNTLMSRIQASHAGAHNRFEIADEKLAQNLVFHDRMEKKLRMIASILSEDTSDSAHADDGEEE